MPTPEQLTLFAIGAFFVGPKLVEWLAKRFVSKADDAEKRVVDERDAREKEMAEKLDAIAMTLAEMKNDAVSARERQAALTSAHAEVKARIDGMSENYGRRIGQLEQEVAALKVPRRGR